MVCIYCGGSTDVINSRPQKRLNNIWRRRKCRDCSAIITTHETVGLDQAIAVMINRGSEAFQRDKLFLSVYDSLRHRQTARTDATALTNTILYKLYPLVKQASLQREQIIEQTILVLNNFDKAAATHYAAFHKH